MVTHPLKFLAIDGHTYRVRIGNEVDEGHLTAKK